MICDQIADIGTVECPYIEEREFSNLTPTKTDLGIIQLNIRGLLNKQDQIKDLIKNTKTNIVITM